MSTFLAFVAVGATYISGLHTPLSPDEAIDLDIWISSVNAEQEYRHPYPIYMFEADLTNFDYCSIRSVWIQFFNQQGQMVFSSSIEADNGYYRFQLLEEFLDSAILGLTCIAEPEVLDTSFAIELNRYTQAP